MTDPPERPPPAPPSPSAKKSSPEKSSRTAWIAGAIAAAVLVAVAVVLVLVLTGDDGSDGEPEVAVEEIPEGSIALVVEVPEDGEVTQEDYDTAFARAVEQQGLKKEPVPGDPEYDQLREQTMAGLLLPHWIRGEAAERDITLTDEEVTTRLHQVVEENFGDQKEFEKFVREQKFCTEGELAAGPAEECEGVIDEVELMLLAERIQETLTETDPAAAAEAVPVDEVEAYYEENIDTFAGENGEPAPLAEVEAQIRQQLALEQQQEELADFEADFIERWRARTACLEEFVIDRCSNGPEPPPPSETTTPSATAPGATPPGAVPPGGVPGAPVPEAPAPGGAPVSP
jgi:hypothetical protein